MPVGSAEAEVLTHGFVADFFIGIVVTEGEGIRGSWTFVLEGGDVREVFGHAAN